MVIDQVDPATSQFDEVKVMLGFNSLEAAKAGYLSNYEKGWKGIGDATAVTVSQFKDWLEHGNTKQNFATYAEKAWKAKTAAMIPTSAWQHCQNRPAACTAQQPIGTPGNRQNPQPGEFFYVPDLPQDNVFCPARN